MNGFEKIEHKLDFVKIRESVLSGCSTEYAKNRVNSEEISINAKEIELRLTLTDEMRLICLFETSFPSQGFIDCIGFLKPLEIQSGVISLDNLVKLNAFIGVLKEILNFFTNCAPGKYPNLKKEAEPILFFPEIKRRLETILDKFGEIKDSASDELYEIRRGIREKEGSVSRRIASVIKRAQAEGILEEGVTSSIHDGHVLIPVNASSKRKLKGIVYDESASGKTAFIEPIEVIELNNEIRELYFAQQREIAKILLQFSDFIRPYIADLVNSAIFMGEIDFIRAKALCAIKMEAGKPIISRDNEYKLIKGRHPILQATLKREKKEVVPLTFTLTPAKHLIIISGPNAGGKSVCLKTAGLLQYMFQWGMLVPASEISEFRIFDHFFVDIGDEQSIENDLSTYSSHLTNMKELLRNAGPDSLVLIDEFGSGTEPTAGGAIAETILAEIERRGVFGIITTHYTNLKLYAERSTGSINGAMLFDTAKIQPLYKLEMGLPGNSFAFELARKIGLPEQIVKQAEERAGTEYVDFERQLRKISKNRRVLEEKLNRIKYTDKTLESITERYQKELSQIQETKKQIILEAKQEAASIIVEANKKIEATIKGIKEAQAEKERTKIIRRELGEFQKRVEQEQQDEKDKIIAAKMEQLIERKKRKEERKKRETPKVSDNLDIEGPKRDSSPPKPLEAGDKIRIKSNGLTGEITRINNKRITISVGNIISTIREEEIERISNREYNQSIKSSSKYIGETAEGIQERRLNFKQSIDIRGERLSEAIDIVSRYIDDALMVGAAEVKILHGKGNGILKEEIRKYLKTIGGVVSCEDEDIRYGGSGITIVRLNG
jgi:DNA mismatch repair protein MutS2